MAPDSPERLLAQARKGDHDALGSLLVALRPYFRMLARSARRRGSPELEDSDLVQDALVELTRSFDGFRGESVPQFLAWSRRVVARAVGHSLRRVAGTQKRAPARVEPLCDWDALPDSGPSPDEGAAVREESVRMAAAIERLPQDMQQVLVWRLVDDLPHAEIAALLGRSEQAVRMLFVRSVRKLANVMSTAPEGAP